MVGMKRWLKSTDLDNNLKENELPDLIIPTTKKIEMTSRVKLKETENSWRMTMSKLLKSKILVTILMMLIILLGDVNEVSAATIVHSGTCGSCNWEIDNNWVMRIYPTNGVSGILNSVSVESEWPWYGQRWNIKKVVVEDGVKGSSGMVGMFYELQGCIEMDLTVLDTSNVTDMKKMFYDCRSLASLDLSNFNTSNVIDMKQMFYMCGVLTNLDIDSFNTSNVTNTVAMFSWCASLKTINVSSFDTSNIVDMENMFGGCTNLTDLNLNNFDTSNVSDMHWMFNSCKNLINLDLSNFNTSNVTDMRAMFKDCENIVNLDLSNLDTSNVTQMGQMFTNCNSLEQLSLGEKFEFKEDHGLTVDGWGKTNNSDGTEANESTIYTADGLANLNSTTSTTIGGIWVKSSEMMGRDNVNFILGAYTADKNTTYKAEQVEKLVFSREAPTTDGEVPSWDVSKAQDGSIMSYLVDSTLGEDGVQYYTQYIVAKGMVNAKTCSSLFRNYKNMTEIENISYMTTFGTKSMYGMFYYCSKLSSLTLNFDTSAVTNMSNMFSLCSGLSSLTLNFDTSAVRNMSNMFSSCRGLSNLELNFDTTAVEYMYYMFSGCSSLVSLDLSDFNTSAVTDMNTMFSGCRKLTNLELGENFNTGAVKNMSFMFDSCQRLSSLILNFDTSNVTDMHCMFQGCSNLSSLKFGKDFDTSAVKDMSLMFSTCRKLTNLELGEKFDTSAVENMRYMFQMCGVTNLTLNFDTTTVKDMSGMFYNCTSLSNVILNFDTSAVTSMKDMFYGCSGLTNLELGKNFDTSAIENMSGMFYSCINLSSLVLPPNFNKLNGSNMFQDTSKLERIISLRPVNLASDIMAVSRDNSLDQLSTRVLYVPNASGEKLYEANDTYLLLLGLDRIKPIMEINGDNPTKVTVGDEYVDAGVTVLDWDENDKENYEKLNFTVVTDGLNVEINNPGESKKITYTLKYTESSDKIIILDVLTRDVRISSDTTPPRIDAINKLGVSQAQREKLTVIASDNHKIAGYTITSTSNQPALDSNEWSSSNIVYATHNGLWYVWVKDESGNVSMEQVEVTDVVREVWDIGVVPNRVFASITNENVLLIEGEGETKDFLKEDIPWRDCLDLIQSIEVREGVTKLSGYLLADMINAKEISLPYSLRNVETSTFAKTNNFDDIKFPNGTDIFVYEDYNLYSANKSILYVHSNKDTLQTYTVNENVKTIAEYAFANNSNILSITTVSNPTLLEGAFNNVSTLENINGEIGGTSIESYVFENCVKLNGIEMSKDITYIGSYSFSNCDMITNIDMILCEDLTTLDHHAFANLKNVMTMYIYRSIEIINEDEKGVRNVFENIGSNFVENAKVYYFDGCNIMKTYVEAYPDAKVEFILIDDWGPTVESFVVRNAESGTYAANTVLEIVATMSEEFLTTKGTIPEVSIAFGNGTAVKLPAGIVSGRNILYTYTIGMSDYGKLKCVDFDGELYDSLDNRTIFEEPIELTDKEIYARSGVLLESDIEANKYFPTLKYAADYITSNGVLTMLLDEEVTESIFFKANTLVSLDINGKNIRLNANGGTLNTLINNKGILNIKDSSTGMLSTASTSGDVYTILNEGTLSIIDGNIRAQGSSTGTSYSIYNKGELLITGGNIDTTNPNGASYAVYNLGTLRMEGGIIASATTKGATVGLYNQGGIVNMSGGQIAARLTEGNSGSITGVCNVAGTFIVGLDDDIINKESPVIYSAKDGLRNTDEGILEFYDGVIEGEAYRALYTDKVKTVEGYALIRKLIGEREKVYTDLDVTNPKIELTNLNPKWTNGKVTIQAKFIDKESGINGAIYKNTQLQLVNNMVMIEVSENGIYTFKAVDLAGNTVEESIEISNIDKEKPTFENLSHTVLEENEALINVTVKDNASGIKGYRLSKYEEEPKSWNKTEEILTETSLDISISSNGKYYLYAIDQAGNIGKYNSVIEINKIDISEPKVTYLSIDNNGKTFVNSSVVMLKVEAKDDIGVKDVLLNTSLLTNNEVINSENWVPYSEKILCTLPIGDGEKTIYVWVRDNMGKISKASSVTTKLFAQYIGNDGTNSTTFKILFKDENYDYSKELTASDLYIVVKNNGVETYRGEYGEGITLGASPEKYGPNLEGRALISGRYYFIKANNIQGNGTVFIGIKNTAEADKAKNKIASNKLEIATDVTVELVKPVISISETEITVTDADKHAMGAIRVDGKTVVLNNGSISKSELQNKYKISVKNGTVIEAIDKCGNIATKVSTISWEES